MRKNLRGELTDYMHHDEARDRYSFKNNKVVMAVANQLKVADFDDVM